MRAVSSTNLPLDERLSQVLPWRHLLPSCILTYVGVADVNNLNAIIEETPELEGLSLREIMISSDGTTFNNAAQVNLTARQENTMLSVESSSLIRLERHGERGHAHLNARP